MVRALAQPMPVPDLERRVEISQSRSWEPESGLRRTDSGGAGGSDARARLGRARAVCFWRCAPADAAAAAAMDGCCARLHSALHDSSTHTDDAGGQGAPARQLNRKLGNLRISECRAASG